MENLEQMRANAQIQIRQQEEQNFERFCSFVDELEAHDSRKVFEGLAEIEREDNLNKYGKAALKYIISTESIE